MLIFLILLIVFVVWVWNSFISFLNRPYTVRNRLSIVFAPPRSGKTCLATYLALYYAKRGVRVYGNIPLNLPDKYAHMYTLIEWSDIGKYDFNHCEILIDEAGIDLNNRNFKNMKFETIKYLKYHGHFVAGMWYFSQSYDDMDITVRRLADDYYVVGKTLLFKFTHKIKLRRIARGVDIFCQEYCCLFFSRSWCDIACPSFSNIGKGSIKGDTSDSYTYALYRNY